MRSGFEGVEQVVLGRNAADCTAIMSYAPGPLELLPFPAYRTYELDGGNQLMENKNHERHWLRACHRENGEEHTTYLGGPGKDIYECIYQPMQETSPGKENEKIWWRLVKEGLVNPAGKKEREEARRKAAKRGEIPPSGDELDIQGFIDALEKARGTHALLPPNASSYHENTYAFYGADKYQPAWNEVCWRLAGVEPTENVQQWRHKKETAECFGIEAKALSVPPDYSEAEAELADDLNGTVRIQVKDRVLTFEIEKAKGAGDGTVPLYSGAAIPRESEKIKQVFRHEGKARGQPSYEHAGAYKNKLAISVTLYSIAHMTYKKLVECWK
jgi:hypothetical protein